ncbi:hypothetical protein K1719_044702 [Acacia pycnantha]|nr:hypothetical protein K1719_044702 [Acacia pycnantha]
MGTFFHGGNSEIQSSGASGDGFHTLYLLNPSPTTPTLPTPMQAPTLNPHPTRFFSIPTTLPPTPSTSPPSPTITPTIPPVPPSSHTISPPSTASPPRLLRVFTTTSGLQ